MPVSSRALGLNAVTPGRATARRTFTEQPPSRRRQVQADDLVGRGEALVAGPAGHTGTLSATGAAGLRARMARMTGTGRSPSSATCSIASPAPMNALSSSASG